MQWNEIIFSSQCTISIFELVVTYIIIRKYGDGSAYIPILIIIGQCFHACMEHPTPEIISCLIQIHGVFIELYV